MIFIEFSFFIKFKESEFLRSGQFSLNVSPKKSNLIFFYLKIFLFP